MSNKIYDIIKWSVTVGLPATAVFVQTLGLNFVLWSTNGVDVNVVLLMTAVMALGATWLGISSIQYKANKA